MPWSRPCSGARSPGCRDSWATAPSTPSTPWSDTAPRAISGSAGPRPGWTTWSTGCPRGSVGWPPRSGRRWSADHRGRHCRPSTRARAGIRAPTPGWWKPPSPAHSASASAAATSIPGKPRTAASWAPVEPPRSRTSPGPTGWPAPFRSLRLLVAVLVRSVRPMTILILGGTAEARQLAQVLIGAGYDVLTSLAGRVSAPALPVGRVRIGGFGGVGWSGRLSAAPPDRRDHRCDPSVRRPDLRERRASGRADRAAAAAPGAAGVGRAPGGRQLDLGCRCRRSAARRRSSAARPFLTTGRQSLEHFLPWADRSVVARVVDPPNFIPPPAWTVIRAVVPTTMPPSGS